MAVPIPQVGARDARFERGTARHNLQMPCVLVYIVLRAAASWRRFHLGVTGDFIAYATTVSDADRAGLLFRRH